jgi:hypothetical protein
MALSSERMSKLNLDMLALVAEYFTPKEILDYSIVSREFNSACSVDTLWLQFMNIEPNDDSSKSFTAKQFFKACPQYRKFEWLHVDNAGMVEISRRIGDYFKSQWVDEKPCALSLFFRHNPAHWLTLFVQWGFLLPADGEIYLANNQDRINNPSSELIPSALRSGKNMPTSIKLISKIEYELNRLVNTSGGISMLDVRHKNVLRYLLKVNLCENE